MIPRHLRGDVLEATVARFAEPTLDYRLYTRHRPGYKRAYLDLQRLGAHNGEKYLIKVVRVFGHEQFAIEYNEGRPAWLENVRLLWEGSYKLGVGGVELGLERPRLRTYQGQAVLDFVLGKAGGVKAVKDLGGFALRLEDHSIVQAIQVRGSSVWLTYTRTKHDARPHRRLVEGPGQEGDVEEIAIPAMTILRVTRPTITGQPYVVEVDERTLRGVVEALSILGLEDFREMKGRIAEALITRLLPELGMDFVEDHPHRPPWWQVRTKLPGPDLLARLKLAGTLAYVESKWWDNVEDAKRRAIEQVREDIRKYPWTKNGEPVQGAYAAVVDWEAGRPTLRVHLAQVQGAS